MNSRFAKRLKEYLDSECDDFGMDYAWEYDADNNLCDVVVTRDEMKVDLRFRYDESDNVLSIQLTESTWFETDECDNSVKYFWMLVSPALFPSS